MRIKLQHSIAIVSLFLLVFSNSSCNKESTTPPATYSGYFKGKVDGVAFHYTSDLYYGKDCPGSCFLKIISVSFRTGTIRLWCPLEIGEYIFSNSSGYAASLWFGNSTDERYHAGSPLGLGVFRGARKITVSETSANHIKGTFEFAGEAINTTKAVTEGEFYISKS